MRLALAGTLLFSASLTTPGETSKPDPTQTPRFSTLEAAMGNALATQVRRHTTALEAPSAQAYVESVGQRLSAQMPNAGPVDWSFTIIKPSASGGPTHEPISAPGGFIFVPAGLLLTVGNEAEFAGMLAHAMAHVVEKHGTKTVVSQGNTTIFALCWPGSATVLREFPSVSFGCLQFLREYELAADQFAAKAMAATGYSPNALLTYLRRTQPEDSPADQKFSALPPRTLRLSQLEQAIATVPAAAATLAPATNLAALQEEIRSALAKTDTTQSIPSLLHPRK